MTLVEKASWFGALLLACGIGGGVALAQWRLTGDDYDPPRYVRADWLPEKPLGHGRPAVSFERPPTRDGLVDAVRDQFEVANRMERAGRLYSVWSRSTCPEVWIDDEYDRSQGETSGRFELRVDVLELANGRAKVVRRYSYIPAPWLPIAGRTDAAEEWEFSDGVWTNKTCSYSLGPSMTALIESGAARVIPVF